MVSITANYEPYLEAIKELDKQFLTGTFAVGPLDTVFVLLVEDKFGGFIHFLELDDFIELNNIAILPPFYDQGFGYFLIKEILKKEKKIFLEVRSDNKRAIRFYEKIGFKVYRERENYYPDHTSALLMYYR